MSFTFFLSITVRGISESNVGDEQRRFFFLNMPTAKILGHYSSYESVVTFKMLTL